MAAQVMLLLDDEGGTTMMSKDDLVVGTLYCCKARGSVMLLQGFDSSGHPILLVQKPGDLIILGSDGQFPLSLDVFLRHYEPCRKAL